MPASAPDRFGNVRAFTSAPVDPVDLLRGRFRRRRARRELVWRAIGLTGCVGVGLAGWAALALGMAQPALLAEYLP